MTVILTARYEIKPGAESQVDQAIRDFGRQIQEKETGTLLYRAHKDREQPRAYFHYFVFESPAAEDLHRNTDWVKTSTGILYPLTVAGGAI